MNILHAMHAYIHLRHMYTSQKVFLCSLIFYQLIHYLKSPLQRGFHKFQLHFYIFLRCYKKMYFFIKIPNLVKFFARAQVIFTVYKWLHVGTYGASCHCQAGNSRCWLITTTAENTTVILTLSAIWCQECYFGSQITCFAYNVSMCCRDRCEGHK